MTNRQTFSMSIFVSLYRELTAQKGESGLGVGLYLRSNSPQKFYRVTKEVSGGGHLISTTPRVDDSVMPASACYM